MRPVLLAAALVLAYGPSLANDQKSGVLAIGVVTSSSVGCKDRADEDNYRSLAHEGTNKAAVAFANQRGLDCISLSPGIIGVLENVSASHDTTCLRPIGKVDCYWTPTVFISVP